MLGPIERHPVDIDWVICGGESGPKARPMHPSWPRRLLEHCRRFEVPFFFKQWGAYRPTLPGEDHKKVWLIDGGDRAYPQWEQMVKLKKGEAPLLDMTLYHRRPKGW